MAEGETENEASFKSTTPDLPKSGAGAGVLDVAKTVVGFTVGETGDRVMEDFGLDPKGSLKAAQNEPGPNIVVQSEQSQQPKRPDTTDKLATTPIVVDSLANSGTK